MRRSLTNRFLQRGAVLLDGMIAILIFSIGIIGMIALQGTAVKLTTDAKYRTDAAMLADEVIGQMWGVANNASLLANFASPAGTCSAPAMCFATWSAQVQAAMPGSAANPPTIVFGPNGATVTVKWQVTASDPVHDYQTIAPIAL